MTFVLLFAPLGEVLSVSRWPYRAGTCETDDLARVLASATKLVAVIFAVLSVDGAAEMTDRGWEVWSTGPGKSGQPGRAGWFW